MKKIMTLTLSLLLLVTGFSFANPDIMLISANPISSMNQDVVLNGVKLPTPLKLLNDQTKMVPLREMAEGLGYKVIWNGSTRSIELVKGAVYITIDTRSNAYTFARRAPEALTKGATIIDGKTYVPVDFIENYLNAGAFAGENGLEIMPSIGDRTISSQLIITEIKENMIIVKQGDGEAHVMINADTIFKDYGKTQAISLKDLKVGDTIKVEHPSIMILIYPAQLNAFEIERLNTIAYREGTISEIGDKSITVKNYQEEIIYHISDATTIKNISGASVSIEHLRVGNHVKIYHNLAMTKSIPPQTSAISITVDSFMGK